MKNVEFLNFVSIENGIDKNVRYESEEIKLIVVDSLNFVSIENVIDKNVRYDILLRANFASIEKVNTTGQ